MTTTLSIPQATLDAALTNAAALVADAEGCRLTAYQGRADRPGVWTIGYGQITWLGKPVTPGLTITQAQADQGLRDTLGTILPKMAAAAPASAGPWKLGAVTSFAYNLGSGATLSSTLMRLWRAGDVKGAADQFPLWCHSNNQVVLGLQLRRAAERALFLFA